MNEQDGSRFSTKIKEKKTLKISYHPGYVSLQLIPSLTLTRIKMWSFVQAYNSKKKTKNQINHQNLNLCTGRLENSVELKEENRGQNTNLLARQGKAKQSTKNISL